jgi:hypothetical protein
MLPFAFFGTRGIRGWSIDAPLRVTVIVVFGTISIVHSAVAVVTAYSG